MTNIFTEIADDAKALVAKIEGTSAIATVEADVSATYTKYLPAFKAWCATMETTLKGQGTVILEQGLTDIGTLVMSGGNPAAAISTLATQVVTQVKTDLGTDEATVVAAAKNATITAVGLAIAALPAAPATVPISTPDAAAA